MSNYTSLNEIIGRSFQLNKDKFTVEDHKMISGATVVVFTSLKTITFKIDHTKKFLSEIVEISANDVKKKPTEKTDKPTVVKKNTSIKIEKPRPMKRIEEKNTDTQESQKDAADTTQLLLFSKDDVQIKSTKEYSVFDSISGNRELNIKKIQNIVADIKSGLNLLHLCPIIVYRKNEKLMIIDGQHRLEVSRFLECPVYYVETEPLTLQQIARLNSRGEKWKIQDFLNCYVKNEVADYITLAEVVAKFSVSVSLATDLLMNNNPIGKNTKEVFQAGEFKSNFYAETVLILELTNSLFGRYSFSKDRYLVAALQLISKKGLCDLQELKEKIDKYPMLMERCSNQKLYCNKIEQLYNHNNQKRRTIF
jgi:hypothetical protein